MFASALVLATSVSGCMSLQPQLHPTDIEALEQLEDYDERNQAYSDNAIYRDNDARGVRYVKGTRLGARSRSWQSLDLILRSDRNSAAALPEKKLRAARVLTGFLIASGVVLLGGIAASAREGLDLSRINGTGAVLLGGGIATLGFGIVTGVVWGQAKAGYEAAVPIYNDSLALRLGISDADGNFKPPPGVLVDEEGFIILDQRELSVPQMRTPAPGQHPAPKLETPAKPKAAPPPDVVPPADAAPPDAAPSSDAEPPAEVEPSAQPAPSAKPEGPSPAPSSKSPEPSTPSEAEPGPASPWWVFPHPHARG